MAKTSMKLKQQRAPKFSSRAYTRCSICGRPHSVLRNMAFAESASVSLPTKARSRASRRHPGNIRRNNYLSRQV